MKQYICEIKRVQNKEFYNNGYDNDKEHRDFLYINPEIFVGFCARRYHTIYCDKNFLNDDIGKILVKIVFEPMASLKDGKGMIFI